MSHLPSFGLGIFFAFGGVALFGWTLRKTATAASKPGALPAKKSELRAQAAAQTETNKLRIAAAVMVAAGAALMIASR